MNGKLIALFALLLTVGTVLAACGTSSSSSSAENKEKVVIGYFPNVNHAAAMVAKEKKYFEEALGENIEVEYRTFPDGSSFMTALQTGDIHGGLVGPGPAMNNFTNGAKVNVIAAASTGGTVIVARKDANINSVKDLEGKTFISPRVGCTHDVQFETYMKDLGITSNRIGGTMIHVTGKPAQYASMFEAGQVDVATAPEPWASFLEEKVGAKVLVDSDEISFGQTLPAAVLVTNSDLANDNPDLVQAIVNAHVKATEFINENKEEAVTITRNSIKDITKQELSESVLTSAFSRIDFTYAIDEEAIQSFGDSSCDLKFLKEKPDFTGFVNKSFLD